MKKYMVSFKHGSIWHHEYFDTEKRAFEYAEASGKNPDVTIVEIYCKSREGYCKIN